MENTEETWQPRHATLDGIPVDEWLERKSRPRDPEAYDDAVKEAVEEIVIPDHFFSCFLDLDMVG